MQKFKQLLVRGKVARLLDRAEVKLHLGCGANLLDGWINIDTGEQFGKRNKLELVWNLAHGLPFPAQSVDYIYHEHFLEHLTRRQGRKLTEQCFAALKPGGVLRIACPGLESLITGYIENSFQQEEWVKDIATNLVGRSNCEVFNAGMRDWGHRYVYDSDDLQRMLVEAGFRAENVQPCAIGMSSHEPVAGVESRADSIVVEAVR